VELRARPPPTFLILESPPLVVIVATKLFGFFLPTDTSLPHNSAPTLLFSNGYSSIAFTIIIWVLILFLISLVQTKLGVVSATPNFFFFLKKNIYFYNFLFKIKIKNKLHDMCQDLIGLRVISVSQLTINGWND
jgi:hypothetical protein